MYEIKITSDSKYSALDFDLAYGRAKRFMSKNKKAHIYNIRGVRFCMSKKDNSIHVKIKRVNK